MGRRREEGRACEPWCSKWTDVESRNRIVERASRRPLLRRCCGSTALVMTSGVSRGTKLDSFTGRLWSES